MDERIHGLFRDDGSPKHVRFDRSGRARKPPAIVVDIIFDKHTRFQKTLPVSARDVANTWSKVGDAWLSGLGMTKRAEIGREVYERFINALPAFLDRYDVKTATKWIFIEE